MDLKSEFGESLCHHPHLYPEYKDSKILFYLLFTFPVTGNVLAQLKYYFKLEVIQLFPVPIQYWNCSFQHWSIPILTQYNFSKNRTDFSLILIILMQDQFTAVRAVSLTQPRPEWEFSKHSQLQPWSKVNTTCRVIIHQVLFCWGFSCNLKEQRVCQKRRYIMFWLCIGNKVRVYVYTLRERSVPPSIDCNTNPFRQNTQMKSAV